MCRHSQEPSFGAVNGQTGIAAAVGIDAQRIGCTLRREDYRHRRIKRSRAYRHESDSHFVSRVDAARSANANRRARRPRKGG